MPQRSTAFKVGAVTLAAGMMAGYVFFQAGGGGARLFAGSKSAAVAAPRRSSPPGSLPSTGPSTAPATQPANGQKGPPDAPRKMLGGSKSAAVFVPAPQTPQPQEVVETPAEPKAPADPPRGGVRPVPDFSTTQPTK
jgi:hypothetical protein